MIPEPHATLRGAVTWRNQCHDCARLQGVIIQSAVLKIVFLPYFIFFKCSLGFSERQISYRLRYTCYFSEILREEAQEAWQYRSHEIDCKFCKVKILDH